MLSLRLLNSLFIPLVIFACGLFIIYQPGAIPRIILPILDYLPYVLSGIMIILGMQFNLFRLIAFSLLFSALYAINQGLFVEQQIYTINGLGMAWGLPVLLSVITWLPERGLLSRHSALNWLVIVGLIVILTFSHQTASLESLLSLRISVFIDLPGVILVIFALAIAHQIFRLWRYDSVLDGVLLFILIALLWQQIEMGTKPASLFHILFQLLLIWGLIKHSHDMAYRDELTGLPARRALNEVLSAPGRKYVVAMMDIDHFKKFNDRHGHDVGDDVLKIVASKIAKVTGGGRAFRYGGEEFTVVFKGKDLPVCIPHLEAVREDIANYKITLREKDSRPKSRSQGKQKRGIKMAQKKISVTISIGVAQKTSDRTAEEVLKAADKHLYRAKKAGRNCLRADK